MAKLYAIAPNGTTQTLNLTTLNSGGYGSSWAQLQNGLIISFGYINTVIGNNTWTEVNPAIAISTSIFVASACSKGYVVSTSHGDNGKLNVSIIKRDGATGSNTIGFFYILMGTK